jgi:hypothetical protein
MTGMGRLGVSRSKARKSHPDAGRSGGTQKFTTGSTRKADRNWRQVRAFHWVVRWRIFTGHRSNRVQRKTGSLHADSVEIPQFITLLVRNAFSNRDLSEMHSAVSNAYQRRNRRVVTA